MHLFHQTYWFTFHIVFSEQEKFLILSRTPVKQFFNRPEGKEHRARKSRKLRQLCSVLQLMSFDQWTNLRTMNRYVSEE